MSVGIVVIEVLERKVFKKYQWWKPQTPELMRKNPQNFN